MKLVTSLSKSLNNKKSKRKKRSPSRSPSARTPTTPPFDLGVSPVSESTPNVKRRIPFDGFLQSPDSGSSVASSSSSASSPMISTPMQTSREGRMMAQIRGRTLFDYRSVVVDICSLAVILVHPGGFNGKPPPPDYVETFKALLRAEGVRFRSPPQSHPLHKNSVYFKTSDDLRRLVCLMPHLRTITFD